MTVAHIHREQLMEDLNEILEQARELQRTVQALVDDVAEKTFELEELDFENEDEAE